MNRSKNNHLAFQELFPSKFQILALNMIKTMYDLDRLMLDHSHHTSKSLPVNITDLEEPDLIHQCFLNIESTKYDPKKSTLLLLHGYLGETQDYHEFFHIYNKQYNIIACDLRGHGKSDPCTNPNNSIRWTIGDFAADIIKLLNRLLNRTRRSL